MATDTSAIAAVQKGIWKQWSVDVVGVAATVAVLADVFTTAIIVTNDRYREANLSVATIADVNAIVGVSFHAASVLALALLCWLSLGWISSVAGWVGVIGIGSSAVNNLIGMYAGVWLFGLLPIDMWLLVHYVLPFGGFAIGLYVTRRRFGPLPFQEVLTVAAVLFVTVGVPPLVL